MKKRVLAGLAAAMLMLQAGCAAGANTPGALGSQSMDSGNESGTMSEETDVPGATSSGTESEYIEMPADTESVSASEETRGFLYQDEGSDEGEVYNIFCSDERFKNLVSAYCDGYEEITGETVTEDVDGTVAEDDGSAAAEGSDGTASEDDGSAAAEGSDGTASEDDGSAAAETSDGAAQDDTCKIIRGRIGDAEIRWIISSEVGELYLTALDLSLSPESDINEMTDLYIVDAADVQKYVDRDVHAAMSLVQDVGISSHALSCGYEYTRRLGSGDDGVQRAVSWEVSPGVFMYSRQAAIDVLGSDDPLLVQEKLADWESFDAVAAKAAENGYAMLDDWGDSFDAFAAQISGDWLTETGGVKIDEALLGWTDQSERYIKEGYFAGDSGRPCFGTFISADELRELARGTDVRAEDFVSSYGICAGPAGWYRGGSYLVVNASSDQRALTKKILGQVIFNDGVLREMKAEGLIPNNSVILAEEQGSGAASAGGKSLAELADLSGDGAGASDGEAEPPYDNAEADNAEAEPPYDNSESDRAEAETAGAGEDAAADTARFSNASGPSAEDLVTFLGGQDPYPVFAEAAGRVELGEVSVFGNFFCETYEREYASYLAGEKSRDEAMKTFYTEIRDLISDEE